MNQAVTIEVINVDEDGKVTLNKMAPYPGIELTGHCIAIPTMVVSGSQEWQWSKSMSEAGTYSDIDEAD